MHGWSARTVRQYAGVALHIPGLEAGILGGKNTGAARQAPSAYCKVIVELNMNIDDRL